MKVLHVVSSNQRRGAELFALDLVSHLDHAGIEQRVVVLHPHEQGLSFPVPTHAVPPRDSKGIRQMLGFGAGPERIRSQWHPEIVQAHGGEALKSMVRSLALAGGPDVVYRRIGMTPSWMAGAGRKRIHGRLMRRCSAVIAVGDVVAREVIRDFDVLPERVTVIPNAVDSSRTSSRRTRDQVRDELSLPRRARVVLFAGALNDEKDPLMLIKVAGLVPEAVFLVAGEGPLTSSMHRSIEEQGLGERVRMLGTRDDIADLLVASDALVQTSRTEGLPGILIEAGLAGVPVTAFAVGGVSEVVLDGETGALASQRDGARLAERLSQVLNDEAMSHRMGKAALARCSERFEMGQVGGRYLDLYNDLLAGRGRGGDFSLDAIGSSAGRKETFN